MRHVRQLGGALPALLLITGLALTGCDKDSSNGATPAASASAAAPQASATVSPAANAPDTTASDQAVAESLRNYHRHHHGGLTSFISMAIDTLGVDDPKREKVAKIQDELRAKTAPVADAEHALLSTIATGVAAGKIDAPSVDAAVAKVAAASANTHTAVADALSQLHDALSPVERAALVDKVQAHWQVWHKVNVEEKAGSKEKGARLSKLTELLSLTPDQVDKIAAALGTETPVTPQTDPKPADAQIQAFATAFVADKFDPKSLAPSATAAAGHVAKHGGARLARFYEAVTPVLTPDQRTKLAAKLQERLDDNQIVSSK